MQEARAKKKEELAMMQADAAKRGRKFHLKAADMSSTKFTQRQK